MLKIPIKFKSLLFILILLNSCGFSPVYINSNKNFIIKNIEITGDKIIKRKILNQLSVYQKKEKVDTVINLIIDGNKEVSVLSKDSKGNPKVYKVKVILNVKKEVNNIFTDQTFENTDNYTYESETSKMENKENRILSNLISTIIDQKLIPFIIKN